MSLSYLGLDMRSPKKCVSINYPGTTLDVIYDIFGKFLIVLSVVSLVCRHGARRRQCVPMPMLMQNKCDVL